MPTELHATVSLVEGMRLRGANPAGLGAEMDSAPPGMTAAGPSPMELVLQAAGGCTAMDVAFILRKRHIPPQRLEVLLTGSKRDENPKVFDKIEVTYRAKGEGITVEELEGAAALSMKTYCSVFGMLKAVAAVSHKCEVME